jgi:hypothetical protein
VTDYLDTVRRDLVDASLRLGGQANTSRPAPARTPRPHRRAAIAVAALLLVAAPALAVTRPWEPQAGDPRFPNPPHISQDAPPGEQLLALSVLRRAQTAQDRGPATAYALRFFSAHTRDIRAPYIRLLALTGRPGRAVVLVPAANYDPLPSNAPKALHDRIAINDPLCVFYPDGNGDGGAKSCFSLGQIEEGQMPPSLGRHFYGLVPDGVTTVILHWRDGSKTAARVNSNNFWDVQSPATAGAVPPAPTSVAWEDASGKALKTIGAPRPHGRR